MLQIMTTMPANIAATTAAAAPPPPPPPTATAHTMVVATETESPEDGGATSDGGGSATGPHNGREARNLAEKHRRDKLNASIQELSTMVPHAAEATRRLDKTAVLRFATHGLRLQYVFGKATSKKQQLLQQQHQHHQQQQQHHHQQQQSTQTLPLLTDALLQLLDSFFITLTCHGQIVLVSTSVEQLLGHCQSDLYGQNIMQITHPEDHETIRQQLIPRDMDSLFRTSSWHHNATAGHYDDDDNDDDDNDDDDDDDGDHDDDGGGGGGGGSNVRLNGRTDASYYRTPSPRSQAYANDDIDRRLRADRRCFIVRLARSAIRSEAARQYECVKIDGCFRRSDCSNTAGNFPIVSQLIRRSRTTSTPTSGMNGNGNGSGSGVNGNSHHGAIGLNSSPNFPQHDVIAQAALHGISGNDIVLVAMARIIRPPKVMNRIMEPNQLEYRTRHLIDGRIIDCDQRIGLVAGYMKDEVRNLSPFSFMHVDDVRWVIVALRQMYDCNSDYGESCYRLISRNGNFIYLQTKGYLEIDKSTNKVHSFVCINTLLDEAQGRRKVQEMKDKFSAIIKTKIPSSSLHDVPASQNPQQLERIVLYLIENLQKQQTPAAHIATNSTMNLNNNNSNSTNKSHTETSSASSSTSMQQRCSSDTPPPQLALVPPEPASVRNSITRSVSVVNVTAAKNLPYWQRASPTTSYQGSDDASLSPASSSEEMPTDNGYGARRNATSTPTKPQLTLAARQSVLQMSSRGGTHNANASLSTPSNTPDSSPSTPQSNATPPPPPAAAAAQVSVLKRLHALPSNYCDEASDCTSPAKRAPSSVSHAQQLQRQQQLQQQQRHQRQQHEHSTYIAYNNKTPAALTTTATTTATISKAVARSLCQKRQQHQQQQRHQLKRAVISRLVHNTSINITAINNGIGNNNNMLLSPPSTPAIDQKFGAIVLERQHTATAAAAEAAAAAATLTTHTDNISSSGVVVGGGSGGGGKKLLNNLKVNNNTGYTQH